MASGPITSWQIDGETMETMRDFIFLGSKNMADGDRNHEIKRQLILGKTAIANLDSILKSRDITLLTKVPSSQSWGFSSSHVWMWVLGYKEHECWRIDVSELWCWRRLWRVPWTVRRTNQSILKETSPEHSLEGLTLKLQYFDHWWEELTHWKRPHAGKDWRQEEKGTAENETVGWHQWVDGYQFEQAPGVGDRQGDLACCSPWGHRVRHDWVTELNWIYVKSQKREI